MLTVHHLNFSRSTRVLWLLEELHLPYKLISYQRDAGFRAPESLRAVHPLGKAPVIEDGDLILAESAVILDYIDAKYGDGRFAPKPGTRDRALHDSWLHYAEGSAAFPILLTLIGGMTGGLPEGLQAFARPELTKTFDYIADSVRPGPFLMGDFFTIADIQMAYLLDLARNAEMLAGHEPVAAYLAYLKTRPAYAKAIEVGGAMVPSWG